MKNNKAMNLSELAAHGNALDLLLAEVQAGVKVTRLAPAKPRRELLTANRVGGGGTRWQPAARAGHASRHVRAGAANER